MAWSCRALVCIKSHYNMAMVVCVYVCMRHTLKVSFVFVLLYFVM